jgi:hypothetical protein
VKKSFNIQGTFLQLLSPNIMEPGQQCTPPRQKLAKDIKKHNPKHPSKGDLKTKQNKLPSFIDRLG